MALVTALVPALALLLHVCPSDSSPVAACLPRLSVSMSTLYGTAYGSPSPGVNASVAAKADDLYQGVVDAGGSLLQIGIPWDAIETVPGAPNCTCKCSDSSPTRRLCVAELAEALQCTLLLFKQRKRVRCHERTPGQCCTLVLALCLRCMGSV